MPEGEIEYHGRVDLQVKVRGYRIELTEIESVLLAVPGIAAAVVDTFTPASGGTELVGYYSVRRGSSAIDAEVIYAVLRERLPSYMVPAYLERLEVIPMTTSDKVDRNDLPPPAGARLAGGGEYVAPTTDTERILADLLAQALSAPRVSVDAHFFDDLGANSLLMTQFSARARGALGLARLSIRDIYLNPTIHRLAVALGQVVLHSPPEPTPRARPWTAATQSNRRRASRAYFLCGAAQLAFFLAAAYLGTLLLSFGFTWISAGTDFGKLLERSAVFTSASFVAFVLLPILAKWLLVGVWTPGEIRLWSLAYLRFWVVKVLVRANPIVLFAGTPVFVFYLRALGAKIGAGVTIHAPGVPLATDLITIGDRCVIGRTAAFSGYRAVGSVIQLGPITLGSDTHVGEKSVLDIGIAMGEGAELGHSSTLLTGQSIPPGQTWHGCPAEPTNTSYRTCPPVRCSGVRKFIYCLLQLLSVLVIAPIGTAAAITVLTRFTPLAALLVPGNTALRAPLFYLVVVLLAVVLFVGGTLGGLLFVLTVSRLLNRLITAGRSYPLYGFHYVLHRLISGMTNLRFYMMVFGDSSAVMHYVRAIGYDLGNPVQTGSNFGTELRHDAPMLTRIGTGTMVSDALIVLNVDYSGLSFRLCHVRVGDNNYLGNDIAYPAGARVGKNCLLATKVMVPIDGPVRENVGLLGSPPFEIPRSVNRDSQFDYLKEPGELRARLAAKNRHNLVTALIYLLMQGFQVLGVVMLSAIAFALFGQYRSLAVVAALLVMPVLRLSSTILVERIVLGFRRLRPQLCSIYQPYFWHHERHWKLVVTPGFPGTPFNPLIWRLAGVRMGKRVFDDGCGIPEKTLVSIGDDAVLNVGSVIQCHSLEDGTFKSDYTSIGAAATIGVSGFVHYGVTMGEGSALEADAFLMKGEQVAPAQRWAGNPASAIHSHRVARREVGLTRARSSNAARLTASVSLLMPMAISTATYLSATLG